MSAAATSVLTPARGRGDHLANLLAGLRRARRAPCELIVGWMGGADPEPVLAGNAPFRRRAVAIPGAELPLARARNDLANAARGELLVFLDVDCVPSAGLLDAFTAALAEHDALAVGRTFYLPPEAGGDEAEARLRELAREPPQRARLFGPEPTVDEHHELFWSLNFAVRRSTFLETIGGFDEGYEGYGIEDTDFGLRARERGVPLAWCGQALAFHQYHEPTRHRPDQLRALVANAKRFQRTWGSWPARGWLEELAGRGLVRWDEGRGVLEPADGAADATRSR
jgi:GT2 family glycosyltransferase